MNTKGQEKAHTQSNLYLCLQAGVWKVGGSASSLSVPFLSEYLMAGCLKVGIWSNTMICMLPLVQKVPKLCSARSQEDIWGEEKHFWRKTSRLRMTYIYFWIRLLMSYVLTGKHIPRVSMLCLLHSRFNFSFVFWARLNCFHKKIEQLYKEILRDADRGIVGDRCIRPHNLADHAMFKCTSFIFLLFRKSALVLNIRILK